MGVWELDLENREEDAGVEMSEIYRFSNGVMLRRAELLDIQLARYAQLGNPNLHEPVEERWLLQTFEEKIPSIPIFLDVGAAVGYYSILIKLRFANARVISVEPLPRHIKALQNNLILNGLNFTDVSILPVAISTVNGTAPFIERDFSSMLGSPLTRSSLHVATRTLSSILSELPQVHLMKMDIQGAESEVLMSAHTVLSEGRIRHMVIGTHDEKKHQALVGFVKTAGYRVAVDDPSPPMQPDGLIVATFDS